MTMDDAFLSQIIRSQSRGLESFWIDWIISLIPSVTEGVQKLLSCKRAVKARECWDWEDGSMSNSVLFLNDNCWAWVIYGVNNEKTREEIQKFGSLMIYLISHLTLETALYADFDYSCKIKKKGWFKSSRRASNRVSDPLPFPWDSENCLGIQEALVHVQSMMLSSSQGVKFPPPFLLVKLIELEKEKENQPTILSSFLKRASQSFFWMRSKPRMSFMSAESKTGLKYITMDPDQYSTFVKHQCISCSYSVESPISDIPCVLPTSIIMQYYQNDTDYADFTIKEYIHHLHSKSKLACPEGSCTLLFYQHILNYSHYKYNLAITMKFGDLDQMDDDDNIYVWTNCLMCGFCSKETKMTQRSLLYSFGKYLELIFYSNDFYPSCNHGNDRGFEIVRNFRFKSLIISCCRKEIELSQVRISPIQLIPTPSLNADDEAMKYTIKAVQELSENIIQFYGNILYTIDHLLNGQFSTGKVPMMLEDMRIVFLEEEQSLLEGLKTMAFANINDSRIMISNILKRDKDSFESWLREFAPDSQFYVPLTSQDNEVELVGGNAILLRFHEPTSLIAFVLLSPDFKAMSSNVLTDRDMEWNHRPGNYESRMNYVPEQASIDADRHIKCSFRKANFSWSCTFYFAREFRDLRNDFGISSSFPFSLERCIPWKTQGGKSQVDFFRTVDDRYVIKQLASKWTIAEKDELLKFAPSYFQYVKETVDKPSILAKIFGFFSISQKDKASGQNSQMDLIIMENIFANISISRKFDLKGIPDRKRPKKDQIDDSMGLDHDWVEGHYKTLFKLHSHSKHIIQESVDNDLTFLSRSNVMDYSLLVGIHGETQELIIGIVDFIGPYNWYKKIECKGKTTFKQTLGGSDESVTILEPTKYAKRFRKAIDQYFLAIPDKWQKISGLGDLSRVL